MSEFDSNPDFRRAIVAEFDRDVGKWVVAESCVPGLHVEADSLGEFWEVVGDVAGTLLAANGGPRPTDSDGLPALLAERDRLKSEVEELLALRAEDDASWRNTKARIADLEAWKEKAREVVREAVESITETGDEVPGWERRARALIEEDSADTEGRA